MTSLYNSPRTVRDSYTSLEVLAYKFMLLKPLKLIEWAEVWIAVAKIYDEPNSDLVVLQVVQIGSAEGVTWKMT